MTTTLPARRVPVPDPHVLVLFGATGDLAARKLLPGLFHLQVAGLMPEDFRVVGTSPVAMDEAGFREHVRDAVTRFGRSPAEGEEWERFCGRVTYVTCSADQMQVLADAVHEAERSLGPDARSLLYLSIPPTAMGEVVQGIGAFGLADARARMIIEKPFGTDYDSAVSLNALLHTVFAEEQVFRIDHFLGKEDVQNILAVRFANRLFEPIWNGEHIARIEIDVPETLDVANRARFYEETGAFRDMIVTHLLQVLGFVAMEPPAAFAADELARGRQAVFDALEPIDPHRVVRGQYVGYRELPDVPDDSDTETLVALEVRIDNDRWRGVPVLLRTGKCMPSNRRVITLLLREPPMHMFPTDHGVDPGRVVFEIAEPGSIRLRFRSKEPGPTMLLGAGELEFEYGEAFDAHAELEAYERLIHDAMLGDRTLFNTAEGIERLWQISMPLLEAPPRAEPYEPGTWGPPAVAALAGRHGWHLHDEGPRRG